MKKTLFALLAASLTTFALAQESFFDSYVFHNWNAFGTLSGTTATDIIQTKDGYIQIGTYEGLVRFDGITFTPIKRSKDNDVSFVSVRAMLEDSRGYLWVGSNDEGLQRLSWTEENKDYTTLNGLPNNSVRALCEDKKGNIWVGTAAGVVYITPDGKLLTPQFEAGTVSKGIIASSLLCDSAGRIWLVTANERGLFVFDDGIFRTRPELDVFGDYFVTSITQDSKGTFWISMGDLGFVKLNNGTIERLKTGTKLDHTPCATVFMEENGNIWFGTEKGLVVYTDGKYTEYSGLGLTTANINKIIKDRESNIWFATDRNGVGKMTEAKFHVFHTETVVNALAEGKSIGRKNQMNSIIWLGTDKGLLCYRNEVQVENDLTKFCKGLRIRDVTTCENGDILVSCYTKPGQIKYESKTGKITTWSKDEGLAGNKVRVAIETAPNELYIGTTTGLTIIHADGSMKTLKQTDGLENEYVMALYKDEDGIVWIGTDGGGIFLMKDEIIFSHLTSEDGLAGNVIFKISKEKDGRYWICSGSGITRCGKINEKTGKPASFFTINSETGLGTDSVFQAIIDTSNIVWMTSNHGISSVPLQEIIEVENKKRQTLNTKFYNRDDGLDSDGPTSTSKSIHDKYGRLWFTMVDGVSVYDPLHVKENPIMPLVHIESVSVDNVEYKNSRGEIILKPGTKRVDIKFTGLSFDAPERISFTHQLTGFDDRFTEPAPERVVSYTNLKPGRHIFYVNAINGDGNISEQEAAKLFVQKPYFYQMPLFWVIMAIILVGTLVTAFMIHEQAQRREKLKLEAMVKLKTADLKREKDNSDRLLRSILPDKIADELKGGEIHAIGENFDDATLLFSDIVGFTNVSSGHTASEIVTALNDLFSRFDDRAKEMGVEKIKTIGDAYMAACGIPSPNPDHAKIMIEFAKAMYRDLAEYNKTASIQFNLRIGLNCGPVTAGVIGRTKFIYDVWGNTVNVASRMETAASPGGIRVSENVYEHLKDEAESLGIKFSEPIECNIKGKGLMTTYDIL